MQIKEVKISNLLSFPYLNEHDFKESAPISFFGQDWYQWVKIFIGNNASWKSNFIKILEEFFATLIYDYTYQEEYAKENIKTRKTIQERPNHTKKLQTNNQTPDQPAKLEISLELSNLDFENIWFVCKYYSKINHLISKYSKFNIEFPPHKLETFLEGNHSIKLKASFDEKTQNFDIDESCLTEHEQFILSCIRYQKLLQIIITIFNTYEKKPEERSWYLLKKTFAILNTHRTEVKFDNFVDPSKIINDLEYSRNSLIWYTECIYKIRSILENFSQAQLTNWELKDISKESIDEKLKSSTFFKSLSYMIKKYLGRHLKVEYINGTISLYMTDQQERISYFDDLSDWEKSLLTIIFGLYWNDLTDGFIIIKEPELHIHPLYQKELAEVCENISEQLWTQFIFSTNSGIFINEKNLTSVYRVYKDKNQNSLISAPRITVDYDDATLMHMLRFENLSKIFFVDKIILVEWDTDAYFFSFYLNYLKTQPEWKEKIRDYEIININGKWSFNAWRKFLRKFNIKNYFIGDWDNTVDFWFFSRAEINKYYLMANQQAKKNRNENRNEKRYSDYYNRLVTAILTFNPKKHKAILKWIEKLYDQNIFILKEWAIETYVPTEKKWLSYVAYFCNAYFYDWLLDEKFAERRQELENIMKYIFMK